MASKAYKRRLRQKKLDQNEEGGRGREREGGEGRERAGKGGKGRGAGRGREGRRESRSVIEAVEIALQNQNVIYSYRVTGTNEEEFIRCKKLQGHSNGKFLARAGNTNKAPLVELLDKLNQDFDQKNLMSYESLANELNSFGVDDQYESLHTTLKNLSLSTGMQAIIGVEGMGNCAIFSADVIHILLSGASPSWPNGEKWTSDLIRTDIASAGLLKNGTDNPQTYLSLDEFWAVWDKYSDSKSPAPAALVNQGDSWEWFVHPKVKSRRVTAKFVLAQSKSHFFAIAFENEITVKDSLAAAVEADSLDRLVSAQQHKGPSQPQGNKGSPPSPSPTFPPFHPSTLPPFHPSTL